MDYIDPAAWQYGGFETSRPNPNPQSERLVCWCARWCRHRVDVNVAPLGSPVASNHDQARSIQKPFGTVETRNRVANPTSSRRKYLETGKATYIL
jgi:hypothetical protein